ncbi:MAG: DegV family protein [Metamycoplasmataceae bacterium]
MKLVIVVDSSSGLTKKQAEARGWHFLPLFTNIDNKEYEDGVTLDSNNFFEICKNESEVSTSCSSVAQVEELLSKIAKPDTFVVIYPISKHLSAQYKNCLLGSQKYQNVHVINSENICYPVIPELVELEIGVRNNEISIQEGIDIIEHKTSRDLDNLIIFPKFNDSLVRGGRLSPSAAKLAKLLKIVPIIVLKNGKLEKLGKGRIFDRTVIKTIVDKYNELNSSSEDWILLFSHSKNSEKDSIINEISRQTQNKKPFMEALIPPVIAVHTGFEAIAMIFLKLKYDINEYKFEWLKE